MLDFIKKLQEKPRGARRRIAFIISGLITLVIFVVWFTAIDLGQESSVSQEENTLSPFDSITNDFQSIWSELTDRMEEARTSLETLEFSATSTEETSSSTVGSEGETSTSTSQFLGEKATSTVTSTTTVTE